MTPPNFIRSITIEGYKSIRKMEALEVGPVNVFIGQNGAGKSNLISFFKLLNLIAERKLQHSIKKLGGASRMLFDGPSESSELKCTIKMGTDSDQFVYQFTLEHSSGDQLIFSEEKFGLLKPDSNGEPMWCLKNANDNETCLPQHDEECGEAERTFKNIFAGCHFHQFHDTSATSRLKQKWSVNDHRELKEDGGNLAPFLFGLKKEFPQSYTQIKNVSRLLVPFFDDFVLNDESGSVLLQWKETGSDMLFDAASASDGMLRIFALIALLCQPPQRFPSILFLDEPELGLHPAAIEILADLIKSASAHVQFFIATQSMHLIDQFDAGSMIVVERDGRETTFTKLEESKLDQWLEEYTLSQLWWKNLIGGKP